MFTYLKENLIVLKNKLNPVWEEDLLELVYKKYNAGLLILAYMASIGQTYFAYLDYNGEAFYNNGENFYNGNIRLVNIILCVLYILFFKEINNQNKIDWHIIVVTYSFLGEVEVEIYATGDPFNHPSNWFMIPLLMLYHAFYIKNTPQKFALYWFVLLSYYYIRVALSPVASFFSMELLGVIKYFIPSYIFACAINYLWMNNRYTNQVYLRDLNNEISKRIEKEKELAIQKARENLVDDIHDHLGSAILDMKWSVLGLIDKLDLPKKNQQKLYTSLFHIDDALRMNINSMSDVSSIQQDFLIGIRKILFRRYEIFMRQVKILNHDIDPTLINSLNNPQQLQIIYFICMEICSFDLKSNNENSIWNFYYDEGLILVFQFTNNGELEEFQLNLQSLLEILKKQQIPNSIHSPNGFYELKIYFFKSSYE